MATRNNIFEMSADALAQWLAEQGEPPYRAGQILSWLCQRYEVAFNHMTNLPLRLRTALAEKFAALPLEEADRAQSTDAQTAKFLFKLADGEHIESVSMADSGRTTFCISSQVGCPLNCRFCATGAAGFVRNLTTGEILAQVQAMGRAVGAPRNIVLMGMGEPLLNLDSVMPALEALADPQRFALSARHLSVSTAGIPVGIERLAACSVRPNLALSLNSPFNDERSNLMPVNRRFSLDQVLDACEHYVEATGRRILLEYVLLGGVNTSKRHAAATARLARRLHATVNLIAFNPVDGSGFSQPERAEVQQFRLALEAAGVEVCQRFRRGQQIAAGCGQLRGRHRRSKAPSDHS